MIFSGYNDVDHMFMVISPMYLLTWIDPKPTSPKAGSVPMSYQSCNICF